MSKKVMFNIKKAQAFPITSLGTNGVPTYGTTKLMMPGMVSISLDVEGSSEPFYADGIVYYTASASTSYTGTIENALLQDEFLTTIFKYFKDSNDNLVETDETPQEFGMQFAVDSDDGEVYFTLFRVSAQRPNHNFQTKEDSANINPQSFDITIMPITMADGTNVIKSYAEKDARNYATYFNSITVPTRSA